MGWRIIARGDFWCGVGEVGELRTTHALPLVITAASGSPAAANSPNSVFTASLAICSADNDLEMIFGLIESEVTVVFDLFLYDDSGTKRFFKWGA